MDTFARRVTRACAAIAMIGCLASSAQLAAAPAAASAGAAKPIWAVSTNRASQFNGTWFKNGVQLVWIQNPPYTPAAQARYDALRPQDNPGARCTESGIGRMMLSPGPIEVVALDNHLLVVAEYFHAVRRIWTDRSTHTDDPDPGFYGDTAVTWDGDTMVVDITALNGLNWLDTAGTFSSPTTHIVERWSMKDRDTLQIAYTFDDPALYTHPWSATLTFARKSDWRLGENSCDNNHNNPDDPNSLRDFSVSDAPQKPREMQLAPIKKK